MKIVECKKQEIYDIGFINTNIIDVFLVEKNVKEAEDNLLQSLIKNQNKDYTLSLQRQMSVTVVCIFGFPYYSSEVIVM